MDSTGKKLLVRTKTVELSVYVTTDYLTHCNPQRTNTYRIMADKAWDIVSRSVPISTLYEALPVPYELVIKNLYHELEVRSFAPHCVECLKKRSRKGDHLGDLSLFSIFCASNMREIMSDAIFDIKLESMNVWTRYDFESYIMVAAIVSDVLLMC